MIILTDKENIKDIIPYKDLNFVIFGPDGLQASNFFMMIRETVGWDKNNKRNCDSIRGIYTVEEFPQKHCYIFYRPETYETKSYSAILEYIKTNNDKTFVFVLLDNPPFKDKGYDDFLKNIYKIYVTQKGIEQ
jgi:hypothetical protein